MEDSILISTKKILGLPEEYTPFDLDVITHINATFSTLSQIGIIPNDGFMIEDETAMWSELNLVTNWSTQIRTYMFLKVRMLFDPPTTSYLIEAMEKQIKEIEWRLNVFREMEV